MRYLFIGAHCDEELCFAGTMTKLSSEGHHVQYLAMSSCGNSELHKECSKAVEILGVNGWVCDFKVRRFSESAQEIADYFYNNALPGKYDFVFSHSIDDIHDDHRTVAEQARRIFKGNFATYTGAWNATEIPNYFIELSEEQLEKKVAALACYKSQSHRPYMSPDFIRAQAVYNGIKCGKKYAEAFRIERLIN